MKNRARILIVVGIVMVIAASFMFMSDGAPKASPALVAQCRELMNGQGAEMIQRCEGTAFATGMTATDANAAARAISEANNVEFGSHGLAMFLLGLGAVLTVAGVITTRRTRGRRDAE